MSSRSRDSETRRKKKKKIEKKKKKWRQTRLLDGKKTTAGGKPYLVSVALFWLADWAGKWEVRDGQEPHRGRVQKWAWWTELPPRLCKGGG